jgi:hypothetical protein
MLNLVELDPQQDDETNVVEENFNCQASSLQKKKKTASRILPVGACKSSRGLSRFIRGTAERR